MSQISAKKYQSKCVKLVSDVVCFLLGDSPVSDLYMPTFRGITQKKTNNILNTAKALFLMSPATVNLDYECHEFLLGLDNTLSNKIKYTMVNKTD